MILAASFGFLAAHGLQRVPAFFAAQGLPTLHDFVAPQGLLALRGAVVQPASLTACGLAIATGLPALAAWTAAAAGKAAPVVRPIPSSADTSAVEPRPIVLKRMFRSPSMTDRDIRVAAGSCCRQHH